VRVLQRKFHWAANSYRTEMLCVTRRAIAPDRSYAAQPITRKELTVDFMAMGGNRCPDSRPSAAARAEMPPSRSGHLPARTLRPAPVLIISAVGGSLLCGTLREKGRMLTGFASASASMAGQGD
jgi:hypothetical protein